MEAEEDKFTDEEIAGILRQRHDCPDSNLWITLRECATDPGLKAECDRRFRHDWHVEEYNAGLL